MSHDRRLSVYLVTLGTLLASAAAGGPATAADPEPTCEELLASGDTGLRTYSGNVVVGLDETCPHPDDVTRLKTGCACPILQLEAVCGFVGSKRRVRQGRSSGCGESPPVEESRVCTYEAVGVSSGVCCGRPLVHEGHARVAPVVADGRWARTTALAPLALAERAVARAYWAEAGAVEHASVASFARFTLDLLALGAPPELVRGAQQAALDEVHHAELCFGIASALAGAPVGPGPLVVEGLSLSTDLVAFAVATAREGAVGETLAAVEAAARRAVATEPAVRAALDTIVADEARHAALAWRTLEWLLEAHGEAVRPALDAVFAEPPSVEADTPAVESHGVIDGALRQRVLADAWRAVVQPSWAALRG